VDRLNMPGFSAERSLHRNRTLYSEDVTTSLEANVAIRPQAPPCAGVLDDLATEWENFREDVSGRDWHAANETLREIRSLQYILAHRFCT